MDDIFELTNDYFSTRKPRKPVNDFESIKSLIEFPITQSQSIRLGKGVEDIFRKYINKNSDWRDIKPPNLKGKKEPDHLFRHCIITGAIKYAEGKGNINLDTEKRKATSEKILKISQTEGCDPILLALRHYSRETLKRSSCTEYYETQGIIVMPVDEYMESYGIKCPFGSEREYRRWLNLLATELVKEDTDAEHLEAAETLMNLKT